MAVRILQVSGVLALVGAVAVSALCVLNGWRGDSHSAGIAAPSAIEQFKQAGGRSEQNSGVQLSPLVQQAQIFAAYLNPPPAPKRKPSSRPTERKAVVAQTPEVKPPNPSAKFKLHGISYRPSRPEDSMALVWEPDAGHRWIKEGAQLGHILVVEISATEIAYRTGEQTHSMLVDPEYQAPSSGREEREMLASGQKLRGKPDRTVATNTVPSRKAHSSQLGSSENTPARTNRPPMRRYRLGR
jgi:hypothetical protein